MKSIAKALLIATLATASTAALADETWSFASEFPGIVTYADQHKNDAAKQAAMAYPSGGREQSPLAAEFPNIVTYADQHRNDSTAVASAPAFPSSANETTSMASEGLVPGLNSGANAYAGIAQPTHN